MAFPQPIVTEGGVPLVTEGGTVIVTEGVAPGSPGSTPDPNYDLLAAIQSLLPGRVVQHNLLQAAVQLYQSNNFTPLLPSQVGALIALADTLDRWTLPARVPQTTPATYPIPAPPYPTQLPRFVDSNPDPFDGWVEFGPQTTAIP